MIKKLLTVSCMLALAGTAQAATTWTMSAEQPDNNYLTINVREFAKDVEEATNGSLKINVQSNSILLKRPEVKRGVQQGVIQIGEALMSINGNEDAIYEVDSVPFLATSFDESQKLWNLARPAIAERLDKQGLMLLYAAPWPSQGFYTKKEINSLDDLNGSRFRSYSAATSRLATLMGATPTTVNSQEVPQAFSTGVIDSMITSPSTGVDTQAWDYVSHYYDVQAFIPLNFVIVNKRAFSRLSEAEQTALLAASERAETRGWEMGRERTEALTKMLSDHGMTVLPPPDAVRTDMQKIGATMAEEWLSKAGADGQKILDAYRGN